jgi:ubiquinone biosynthesis protein UbiJ
VSLLLTGLTAVLQAAVNQFIELDQNTKSQFQTLAGKVLAVEFTDLSLTLYFLPTGGDLQIYSHYDGATDTRLRGSSIQLLTMGVSERPGERLFKGDVQIDGDTELGQQFQDILRNMDIDWEERLSLILGDVTAHKLGNAVRGFFQWGKSGVASLQENLSEYITYETNSVPARFEVDKFNRDVDTVRDDTERLNVRVQRLQSMLSSADSASSTAQKAVD